MALYIHINLYNFLSGKELPTHMLTAQITPTTDGDNDNTGLLMTFQKRIYTFHCDNADECYWKTADTKLNIWRGHHLMLSVPSYIVNGCNEEEK